MTKVLINDCFINICTHKSYILHNVHLYSSPQSGSLFLRHFKYKQYYCLYHYLTSNLVSPCGIKPEVGLRGFFCLSFCSSIKYDTYHQTPGGKTRRGSSVSASSLELIDYIIQFCFFLFFFKSCCLLFIFVCTHSNVTTNLTNVSWICFPKYKQSSRLM